MYEEVSRVLCDPSLDIVIVNWNSGVQLRKCLESIELASLSGFVLCNVVVVDNASADGSADDVELISLPLTIIRNNENNGFAAACNQWAMGSEADYLLFLNPDTKLFGNSLESPIDFMEQPENNKVGIVGVQLVDDLGHVVRTCVRFPTPVDFLTRIFGLGRLFPARFPSRFMMEWDHLDSREVDQVMGAFFLVRRSLFTSLGGFDERFFVYFEEVDFSLRARKLGWHSFYFTGAQAYHEGGGVSKQIKAKRLFYSLHSRILYCYKHFSWWTATGVLIGTLLIEPFTRLIWAGLRRSIKEAYQTIQAYGLLLRALPAILKENNCRLKGNNMELKK